MEPGGWVFMIVSEGLVVLLVAWCYLRVMRLPSEGAKDD